MNCSRTAGLLVAIVLLHVVATAVVPEPEKMENESERIVGGREAAEGQFPWMAALYYNDQFICSGSILSPNTYMTAAHCVVLGGETQSVSLFHAIANNNRNSSTYQINFRSFTVHPDYNHNSVDNDVAIFTTSQSIPFSDTIQPVCIASPNTKMYQYKRATAMGWGDTSRNSDDPKYPEKLHYVNQKIEHNSLCSWLNSGVNENKICAKGFFNGICTGDSGGPLVHLSQRTFLSAGNPPVQIGIASYINADAGCGKLIPAVFTRVSKYYDFIMQASDDNMICSIP